MPCENPMKRIHAMIISTTKQCNDVATRVCHSMHTYSILCMHILNLSHQLSHMVQNILKMLVCLCADRIPKVRHTVVLCYARSLQVKSSRANKHLSPWLRCCGTSANRTCCCCPCPARSANAPAACMGHIHVARAHIIIVDVGVCGVCERCLRAVHCD